jgi:two-component system, NarL family, invasion response regulator UvrY
MLTSQCFERRFLLVDDHPAIRTALDSIIKEGYPDAIIQESEDGTDVIEKLGVTLYHLIIMDIQMPHCETLWLINYIHINYPATPVLIYSMTAENIYAVRVLKAGAKGFVPKGSPIKELKRAIGLALDGNTYISQAIAEMISQQSFNKSDTPFTILSPREFQIVVLLLAGNTGSEISKTLDICHSTVGTHKGKIYEKLKVANLIELKELSDIYHF